MDWRRNLVIMVNWIASCAKFASGRTDHLTLYPAFFQKIFVYSRVTGSIFSLRLRRRTIDAFTFIEVFLKENYRISDLERFNDIYNVYERIVKSGRHPLIIDCGANNGLSSYYLSEMWPQSKIVAVEPDEENINMLKANTHGKDIEVLHGAVTSQKARLNIIDSNVDSNAFQTVVNEKGTIEGITISDLISRFSSQKYDPFIVKIDIEGFENELFSKNTDWIDSVPIIAIELHDWMMPKKANSKNFLLAVANRSRDFICRDNVVFSIRN